MALLVAVGRTLRRADPLALEIDRVQVSAYLVFVGNGPYSGTAFTGRESLQEASSTCGCCRAEEVHFSRLSALGAILLSPRQALALAAPDPARRGHHPPRAPALLAHDGEVREVSGEIAFRTRPGALRVLVPPAA